MTTRRGRIVALAVSLLLGGALVTQQALQPSDRERLVDKVNLQRTSRDLHFLRTNADLTAAASRQARAMADRGEIFHSDVQLPPGAQWAGEIVGSGPTQFGVVHAWLHSPEHRVIMLYPKARVVGAGAVFDNGRWWLVVQFAHF